MGGMVVGTCLWSPAGVGHGVAPLCIARLDGGLRCSKTKGSAAHQGVGWVEGMGVGTCLWTPTGLGHGWPPYLLPVWMGRCSASGSWALLHSGASWVGGMGVWTCL